MKLYYDPRDQRPGDRRGDLRLYWLDDLGAVPIAEAQPVDEGFLFAGARPVTDYARLVGGLPRLRDRPDERSVLLRLDSVLEAMERAGATVTSPRTWHLRLDAPLPRDLRYPLFLRTPQSSWKLGGKISRVRDERELREECVALRRAFQWDATILAREWLELARAGESPHGPVPQEVRTWIVDRVPCAWSFHHLHVVPSPAGFPLASADVDKLSHGAIEVGRAFSSRLVVADFARGTDGRWWFIEAGPGSCAGTGHEAVFKHVARTLLGEASSLEAGSVGGPLIDRFMRGGHSSAVRERR